MRMSIPGFLGQEVFRGTRPQFSAESAAEGRKLETRSFSAEVAEDLPNLIARKRDFFLHTPLKAKFKVRAIPQKKPSRACIYACSKLASEATASLNFRRPRDSKVRRLLDFCRQLTHLLRLFDFVPAHRSRRSPVTASLLAASASVRANLRVAWRRLSTDSLPRILCFGLYSGKMDANSGPLLLSLVAFLDSLGLRKAAKALRKDSTAQGLLTGEEAELFPGATLAQVVKRGLREKKRHREREGEAAEETQAAAESSEKKKKKVALAGAADAPEAAGEREKKQKKNRFEGKTKQRAQREETPSADSEEAAETTAEVNETEKGETDAFAKKAEKGQKNEHASVLRRFKRVDESKWVEKIKKEDLKDNSFWNKKDDSFAVKAAHDLGKVRGRDFRHEKTKKKRASWKGCGEIPMTVNSIQFDSSDDE
ncbi:SRP40, C-terminal domain-containing protein [Toxoplasma gondii GT1]|uniref:SRP40, C-terminal domain-containing protein n=1 Tax=Toxoplasma gondii (strain ATCC 50853 / GT1) TaxID=507601 RepID=S7VXU1_TOXGG|nr:SRP40, C-terminal domain-containing protein [Toxoplasma gondii GT1]